MISFHKSCYIAVIDSQPLSNDLAVPLYKDKPESFGYQSGFDRATIQHDVINKNIKEANDNANSSDHLSMFLEAVPGQRNTYLIPCVNLYMYCLQNAKETIMNN